MRVTRAFCTGLQAALVLSISACFSGTEPADPDDNDPPPPAINANWSDPATWGGQVPAAGADVVIPEGRNVLLDVSPPPLGSLTINGALVFSSTADIELQSRWIMVHGTLQVGSEAMKQVRRATITLTGDGSGDVMGMGDKVLGVMSGGRLELHGEEFLAWTTLSANAGVGATTLELAQAPDWRVGDRLVVASTDYDPFWAEEATITSVSGNQVGIDTPLRWAHWGTMQTIDGVQLDERAEVALLNRNITIQGDSASVASGIGGHVMVMQGGVARVEGVRFYRMGQKARLARYPMHWHLAGTVSGQYFRNNVVWKSFNRCLTIHGTDNLAVDGNACHDHIGHGYFLEDGAESGNVLTGNLGLTSRAPATGEAVLPSDTRPATFWITNPANTYRNNHAAGSRGFGFWYALPVSPTGLSVGQPDLPRRTPLGEFSGNVAHSNRSMGLNVDDGPRMDGTTETASYAPRQDPANNSPAVPADFSNFRSWKNQGRGVWLRGNSLRLTNALLADNGIGATFASSETWVQNSTFIGESGNNGTPAGFYRGYEFYDGRVGAENVRFINFTKAGAIPSSALGYNRNNSFPINTGNFARSLTFSNANQVYLEDPGADRDGDKAAAFLDETGSVTGQAGVYVVANVPFMLDGTCTLRAAWNAHVCTGRRINFRVNNNGPEPVGPLTITRDDAQALTLVGVPDLRTTATTTVVPNRGYTVAWGTPSIPPRPRFYLNRGVPGEYLRVSVPWPAGNTQVVRDYNSNNPMAASPDLASLDAGTGGWYYDAGSSTLHLKLQVQADRDYATLFVENLP